MRQKVVTVCTKFFLLITAILGTASAGCQGVPANLGFDPTSSFHRFKIDSINLENGNAVIHIPLVSYPQRDNRTISYSFNANSNYWTDDFRCMGSPDASCDHAFYALPFNGPVKLPLLPPKPGIIRDQLLGVGWVDDTSKYCYLPNNIDGQPVDCADDVIRTISLMDAVGTQHSLVEESGVPNTLRTTDGSGYLLTFDQPNPYAVWTDMNVLAIQGPDGKDMSTNAKDENGNPYYSISVNPDGMTETFHDSVGRAIPDPTLMSPSTIGCPNLSLPLQPLAGSSTWSIPGPNGTVLQYLLCYATINSHTNFWNNNGQSFFIPNEDCGQNGGDPDQCTSYFWLESGGVFTLPQSLVLPDGTSYTFQYDATDPTNPESFGYAAITKITYPAGGSVSYQYAMTRACFDGDSFENAPLRYVHTRTETDGVGNSYLWTYNIDGFGNTTVTDPNNNDTTYSFTGGPIWTSFCAATEQEHKIFDGSSSDNRLVQDVVSQYAWQYNPEPYHSPYNSSLPVSWGNILLTSRTTTVPNAVTGVSSVTTESFTYDPTFLAGVSTLGNPAGSGTPISLGIPSTHSISGPGVSMSTQSSFAWWTPGSQERQANLLSYPSSTVTLNGDNSTAAKTDYKYDESLYSSAGASQGKVTTTMRWNPVGPPIITHARWNAQRLIYQQVDANLNNAATYLYSSAYQGLYPTTITNAAGHSDTYTFDFNTGTMTSHTDQNLQTSSVQLDNFGRPWSIHLPDLGSAAGASMVACYPNVQTVGVYSAQSSAVPVPSSSLQCPTASGNTVAKTYLSDGLGRVTTLETAQGSGGAIVTNTSYDGLDRVVFKSDPHIGISAGGTTYSYDPLGRTLRETHLADNTFTTTTYAGFTSTFTNESTTAFWTRTSDALGRLTSVVEPGGLTTTYKYDTLGNLLCVDQWGTGSAGQSCSSGSARTFTYDAVSRLLTAFNPETGMICYGLPLGQVPPSTNCSYGYDANGNLLYKTDARAMTTSYGYDELNRLRSKTYPAGFASACYQYDESSLAGTNANLIGRLANTWTQTGVCPMTGPNFLSSAILSRHSILAYDPMGRPLSEQQCTRSNCTSGTPYTPAYNYDLAGNVIGHSSGMTSGPGMLTFQNSYDPVGRLNSITNAATAAPLFSVPPSSTSSACNPGVSPGYSPFGGLMNVILGAGLQVSRGYDPRLRLNCEIDTGNPASNSTPGTATITINGTDQQGH